MDNPVTFENISNYRIRKLAEQLGMQKTYNFLSAHWNEKFYIPSKPSKKLVERCGQDVAEVLVMLYPDQHYQPPKPDKIWESWRNHEILKDRGDGMLMEDVSKKYNLTRQRIGQIMKEIDPDNDPNLTLDFGF